MIINNPADVRARYAPGSPTSTTQSGKRGG